MRQIEEDALPMPLAGHIDVDGREFDFVSGGSAWKVVEH
jgi:hypothetical protein